MASGLAPEPRAALMNGPVMLDGDRQQGRLVDGVQRRRSRAMEWVRPKIWDGLRMDMHSVLVDIVSEGHDGGVGLGCWRWCGLW
jgi:hypothetical protein